jgi:hypothetical protein
MIRVHSYLDFIRIIPECFPRDSHAIIHCAILIWFKITIWKSIKSCEFSFYFSLWSFVINFLNTNNCSKRTRMKGYSGQQMTTYNHSNIQIRKTLIYISNLLNYKNNTSFPLHPGINLVSSPSKSLIQNQKHRLKQHFKSSKFYRYQQHLAYQQYLNQEQKVQGSRSIPQYPLQIIGSFRNRHSSSTSHHFP